NDGHAHFSLGASSSVGTTALPTSGAAFADVDRDGLIDLFVGTFYAGAEGAGTFLHKGSGDGRFVDVSTASRVLRPPTNGARDAWLRGENRRPSYGITACDADDDGAPDLLVGSYGRGYNELWRNRGGVFEEVGFGTPFAADANTSYASDNEFFHCWCSQNP